MKVLYFTGITLLLLAAGCDCGDTDDMDVDLEVGAQELVESEKQLDVSLDAAAVDLTINAGMELQLHMGSSKEPPPKRPRPAEWDHAAYAKNGPDSQPDPAVSNRPVVVSQKTRLDTVAHPDAASLVADGGQIGDQLRQAVINVHLYFSKISTNPVQATAAALKITRKTVSKIIGGASASGPPETNEAPVAPSDTSVSASPKVLLPAESHADAAAPIKRRGKMEEQFRQAVVNVYLYLSKISTNPIQATAAAIKFHRHTVQKIIKEGDKASENRKARPRHMKAQLDSFDKSIIRRIVHDFFRRKDPPTLSAILREVKKELQDRFPYGESMLRKIFQQLGFKYGRRSGKSLHFMERADIAQWRTQYLRQSRQYRQENHPMVYLDETWFNCNEAPTRVWQDLNVQQNPNLAKHPNSGLTFGLPAASGHGKRLIVVNAIERSGPVPNALLVFPSKNPVTPEDYHKDMDATNFERWFKEQLLPNLKPKSVIVMDNAPYHSRKENTCALNLRKAQLIACLTERGFFAFLATRNLPSDPATMTKTKALELWKQYRSHFEYYAVDKTAEKEGHIVLRLPPYHCVFTPIEMLWGYQKGRARMRGGGQRTIGQATETCQQAFSEIPREDLSRYFDHAIAEENKYWSRDGINDKTIPPFIIPLFDSSSESGEGDETAAE